MALLLFIINNYLSTGVKDMVLWLILSWKLATWGQLCGYNFGSLFTQNSWGQKQIHVFNICVSLNALFTISKTKIHWLTPYSTVSGLRVYLTGNDHTRTSYKMLDLAQYPSWTTTSWRLSMLAYSVMLAATLHIWRPSPTSATICTMAVILVTGSQDYHPFSVMTAEEWHSGRSFDC